MVYTLHIRVLSVPRKMERNGENDCQFHLRDVIFCQLHSKPRTLLCSKHKGLLP